MNTAVNNRGYEIDRLHTCWNDGGNETRVAIFAAHIRHFRRIGSYRFQCSRSEGPELVVRVYIGHFSWLGWTQCVGTLLPFDNSLYIMEGNIGWRIGRSSVTSVVLAHISGKSWRISLASNFAVSVLV